MQSILLRGSIYKCTKIKIEIENRKRRRMGVDEEMSVAFCKNSSHLIFWKRVSNMFGWKMKL